MKIFRKNGPWNNLVRRWVSTEHRFFPFFFFFFWKMANIVEISSLGRFVNRRFHPSWFFSTGKMAGRKRYTSRLRSNVRLTWKLAVGARLIYDMAMLEPFSARDGNNELPRSRRLPASSPSGSLYPTTKLTRDIRTVLPTDTSFTWNSWEWCSWTRVPFTIFENGQNFRLN